MIVLKILLCIIFYGSFFAMIYSKFLKRDVDNTTLLAKMGVFTDQELSDKSEKMFKKSIPILMVALLIIPSFFISSVWLLFTQYRYFGMLFISTTLIGNIPFVKKSKTLSIIVAIINNVVNLYLTIII